MRTLQIKELYFKYPNATTPIFEPIDLEFHKGWTAIIGSNGSGKSTLLRLIANELQSDITTIKGNDLVYYCHQSTQHEPKDLKEFLTSTSSNASKIKEMLGIDDAWIAMWDVLSHGERKRLQIALALFSDCDVLMVDEPTNHLDIKSKEIVKQALKSFTKIGILVSHDRELLDALSRSTMMIKESHITTYNSPFSLAMNEYKSATLHRQKIQDLQGEKIKKLDQVIQGQKEKVSQSKKRISKKSIDPKDSDAREKINRARLTGKDKNDGQMLKRTLSKRQRLLNTTTNVKKESLTGITFDVTRSKKSFPIVIEANTIKISNRQNLCFDRTSINEGDKIHIAGENGSGKSTLIRYILSLLEDTNTYLYIPQEITDDESKRVFGEIETMSNEEKGALFTLIKRLSSDPKRLMQSTIPSPGEVRKILIAKGSLNRPALIILDEPTNHMDLASIEALEQALKEYSGTLIIISHDKVFSKAMTNTAWVVKKVHEGLYKVCKEH